MIGFINYAWIVGLIILAMLGVFTRNRIKNNPNEKRKLVISVIVLAVLEFVLIVMFFAFMYGANASELPKGMSFRSVRTVTSSQFKVSYELANREFDNQLDLTNEELENIQVIASAESGTIYLKIVQGNIEEIFEITGVNQKLDMSSFEEGEITFILGNENARGVDFELIW